MERHERRAAPLRTAPPFDAALEMVSRYDRSLRIVSVNGALCSVAGLSADQCIGAETCEVVSDRAFADRVDGALREVIRSGEGRLLESEAHGANGSQWYSLLLTPQKDDDGEVTHVLMSGRDVTAVKRTEDALRVSEGDLRIAQSVAGIGSWSTDLRTGATTWSDELFAILGYEAGEVQPGIEVVGERLHPGDVERVAHEMVTCLAEPAPVDIQFRLVVPGGPDRCLRFRARLERDADGQLRRAHGTFQDITEQKTQAEALERSQVLLDGVLQSSVDGIMAFLAIRDGGDNEIVDFEWLLVNAAAGRLVGRPSADLIGRRLLVEMPGNAATGLFDRYVDVVRTGRPFEIEHHYAREGLDKWFHTVAVPLDDGFAVTFADITERRRAEAALRHRQLHDPLTGLANRTLVVDRLAHALERQVRTGQPIALLVVNVHRMRAVNEAFGHRTGDAVLRAVSGRLRSVSRSSDTIGRLGSDEFLVLCEGLDAAEVDGLARRLLEATATPVDTGDHQVTIQVDIGVVLASDGAADGERLLAAAHNALLQAKAHGPGCHEFLDEQIQGGVRARAELEAELRRGIERGELVVLYQPVVRTNDFAVVGFEALVRWQHPERGLLPPADFIPLAEETGLVVPIGSLVLDEACRQRSAWGATLGARGEVDIAVNLSARELADPGVVARVKHALATSGIPPAHLCLEVTETGLLDVATAPETLERLAALGVRIALDDFGTGYSSVGHLRRFPVDVLKIDRSFVSDLPTAAGAPPVVAALAALAHTLSLEVVAEGVETAAQFEAVRRLGVQRAQGYLFARPLAAEDANAMLARASTEAAGDLAVLPAPAIGWDERTLELVRRLPDRFLVVLDESYTVRWASHFAGRILGTNAASLVGRPAVELIHPDDFELGVAELRRLSDQAEADLRTMEADLDHTAKLSLLAEDGSSVRVEFKAFNLFADPDVVALGLLGWVVSSEVRLDAVIDRLGTETPLADVLALLVDYLSTAVTQADHRIVRFVDGNAVGLDNGPIADDPFLPAVVLDAARQAGNERTAFRNLDVLPPVTQATLVERQLTTCFIRPIVAQGRPDPLGAVLTWTKNDTLGLGVYNAIATTARLAGIAMAVHGAAEGLRAAAMTDALTGLGNRRQLDHWMTTVHGPVTVLAIDLDEFKPVNDEHGHAAGDVVLTEAALRLQGSCRPDALVARPGGDEFVVLIPGIDRPDRADALAVRFLEAMAAPIDVGGRTVTVKASVGSAVRSADEPIGDALARADANLYRAKTQTKAAPRGDERRWSSEQF